MSETLRANRAHRAKTREIESNARRTQRGLPPLRRLSPYTLLPSVPQGQGTSVRVCVEHPDAMNDYRYLFRRPTVSARQGEQEYVWLSPDATPVGPRFSSIFDACVYLNEKGYIDASW